MTKCMAAPSQAFAHSPAAPLRGAHSAISRDVLVPQANSSSMVPITKKARPATNDTAASGRNGPMTWAPAMKKSPKMPPRPFGSGQLFGWGRAAKRGGEQDDRSGPGEEPHPPALRHGAEHEVPAPGGERQEQDDRGKPERLDGEVGDHGAPAAEHIARRGAGGVVEARVVHRPGGEARPGGAGDRDDHQTVAAEHEPAQAGLDRSRQQLSPPLRSSSGGHPSTQCGDDARQGLARGVGVMHERNPDVVRARIDAIGFGLCEISSRQHFDTTPFPKGFRRPLAAPESGHIRAKERRLPPAADSRSGRPEWRRRWSKFAR